MNRPFLASRSCHPRLPVFAVALVVALVHRSAHSCVLAGLVEHGIDPAEQAADTQPPAAPKVSGIVVHRGIGPRGGGCGGMTATSCDDIGSIQLIVNATDDRTATPDMGYRLSIASGTPPTGLNLPTYDVRTNGSDGLVVNWIDGATDDQESVDFELRIFSVDRAGNVSATDTVARVQNGGHGSCAVAVGPRGVAGGPLLFIAVAAMAALRRRRPFARR